MIPELKEWWQASPKENLTSCKLDGTDRFQRVSNVDRYGLPARFVVCERCGIVYLQNRPTEAAYSEFYASGLYRRAIDAWEAKITSKSVSRDSSRFYQRLVEDHADLFTGASVIDVGGGNESMASALRERNCIVTVVDPADEHGAGIESKSITDYMAEANGQKWDVGVCLDTLDHLLDPFSVLSWLRERVDALLVSCVNFPDRYLSAQHFALKVDHPTNFNKLVFRAVLPRFGWKVVAEGKAGNGNMIMRCVPEVPAEILPGPASIQQLIWTVLCSCNTSPTGRPATYWKTL